MKKLYVLCVMILLLSAIGTVNAMPVQWKLENGGNGHWYEVFLGTMEWDQAKSQVEDGYHLATITSAAEQKFLAEILEDFNVNGEFWLGAYQEEDMLKHDEGWHWVTKEEWEYTNWQSGEPNEWNGHLEDHLGMWSRFDWKWNDEHDNANIKGYITESSAPVPEPATLLLFGTGLVGMAGFARRLKK